MALVYADRVQETSTTTGTGTYNLAGAVTGFQGFVAGIGNANTWFLYRYRWHRLGSRTWYSN